jgi:hypothetical protein
MTRISYEQNAELHLIARETYDRVRIGRPHMPLADSDEGQRKIDRLYAIMRAALTAGEPAK